MILICQKPLPAGMTAKVQSGRPETEYDNGKMDAPYLVEMTTDGRVVWEWRSWEHLDPEADRMTAGQDDRDVWTVGNGVSEMPDGNILLSFRDISTVVMINRQTGAIYWKLGAPPLAGQHAPYMLANGNVLLFDNGPHRLDQSFPRDRDRSGDQVDRLEVPGTPRRRLLQPEVIERPAAAEWQHADQRRLVRPVLRGDARWRDRLGVRQPLFRGAAELCRQCGAASLPLRRRGHRESEGYLSAATRKRSGLRAPARGK